MLSACGKRADHFRMFIILCANFSKIRFEFIWPPPLLCIPDIVALVDTRHLIKIDSKNGSVQLQTPLCGGEANEKKKINKKGNRNE